ncbi:hypothetical protein BJF83_21485 [Nocardiopsis sp. CNR-923]|uniref:hypothetical protein n=1 Tax=Nocardiopsis sp. CNR-923 TaxID=1904965 RepID=UPI000962BDA8|nr:hypothetical protein [Nocardiopsis sp. CNR-923]OLT26376.1 hypothetical protein BJF83_21485 [Nocardiopsis sp. CNR-923]
MAQRALTLQELVDILTNYVAVLGPDAPVRLATQPSWPMEYEISATAPTRPVSNENGAIAKSGVVYLAAGEQLGYLTSEAREALGWEE